MYLAYTLAHYFFPRHSNNHKAKILHASTLYILVLSLIFYQIVLQFLPLTGLKILGYASNIGTDAIIELTNQKRNDAGVGKLEYNPLLAQAARAKGENMLSQDYWAHIAPDGTQPWKFFTDAGYIYRYAGENLARDFSDPASAVTAWMASPSHKENLLSSKYRDIGVAVVEGDLNGVDTTIIVQLFGTPYVDTAPALPVASADVAGNVAPTPPPEPTVILPVAGQEVSQVEQVAPAGDVSVKPRFMISPFSTTKGMSLFTVGLLLAVLVVDGLIIANKKITRIGGRTVAHLAFLGMVLIIIIIVQAGEIL
jgi:hypothetical protein